MHIYMIDVLRDAALSNWVSYNNTWLICSILIYDFALYADHLLHSFYFSFIQAFGGGGGGDGDGGGDGGGGGGGDGPNMS